VAHDRYTDERVVPSYEDFYEEILRRGSGVQASCRE
jgi:hypothetical protein